MTHYKPDFDEKKMWAYGCHCMYLGDRPLSGMGSGKPVDVFDKICQDYKNCQKCAREEHGETCIGEFVEYNMDTTQGKVLKCKSKGGSCERELCECDKKFAQCKFLFIVIMQFLFDPDLSVRYFPYDFFRTIFSVPFPFESFLDLRLTNKLPFCRYLTRI